MKQVLGKMRRAIEDYQMISEGDVVCAAVSGGKDSMLMLKALSLYRLFSPVSFTLKAICLDMGFGNMDFDKLKDFCQQINVPLTIRETQIAEIVFQQREEKNPCSLCANLRRGALHNLALELGSSKIALGHHADDLIETFFLSMLYEGRMQTFKAVTFLDRKQVTVIRPLIYMREKDIIYHINKEEIPVIKSKCPVDGITKRAEMKKLIKTLSVQIPKSDDRIINAVTDFMNDYL